MGQLPDLTGLRSTAPRGDGPVHCKTTVAWSKEQLDAVAISLIGHRVDDAGHFLFLAACAIVAHHLFAQGGSDETPIEIRVPARQRRAQTHDSDDNDDRDGNNDWNYNEGLTIHYGAVTAPKTRIAGICFYLDERQGQLEIGLSAAPSIHTDGSAAMHLQQIAVCLDSITRERAPHRTALSLDRFPDELRGGDNPNPPPSLIALGPGGLEGERFEHQTERIVASQPDAVALDFRASLTARPGDASQGNVQLTYRQLDERASLIAYHLIRAGVKRGDVVALCLEKSPETYLAIYAVLKAGAAWCPIDTDWPMARRQALLEKAKARTVVAAASHVVANLPQPLPNGMSIVRLDEIDYDAEVAHLARATGSSDDLAYLIWTSGTTGLPKAVGIQHKAAVQALRSLQGVIPHSASSPIRYLQFSAYNFDLMILDMFYTWGLGGTLCASSRSLLLGDLAGVATTMEVTHTLLTPAVMAMNPRQTIPSLRVVINGGEKLSQIVADMWSVDCTLLNLYGPAEATLIAMHRCVPPNDIVKAPNIGVALPTTSCHALDSHGDVVLKGAVGELVLGGHQCAKGYIGDEAKTADKFVEHPSLGRVYKTGDLVRQLWNGDFEYLGRSDDQVKINGIRIELLEINAAVKGAHGDIRDSETLAMPRLGQSHDDNDGMLQIVSFSVLPREASGGSGSLLRLDDEAAAVAGQLQRVASQSLPSYMVPSLFVILDHFPRTSSAKIDRESLKRALASLDVLDWQNRVARPDDVDESNGSGHEHREATPEEEAIRDCLAAICGLSAVKVGLHTPFASIGLDSIRAIALSHELSRRNLPTSVVDIVQFPTVTKLARRRHESASSSDERVRRVKDELSRFDRIVRPAIAAQLPGLYGAEVERCLPVTSLQEGMLAETMRHHSRYWLQRAFTLPKDTDLDRLEHAVRSCAQSVEVFRSTFLETSRLEGIDAEVTFCQVVLQAQESRIERHQAPADSSPSDLVSGLASSVYGAGPVQSRPPVAFFLIENSHAAPLLLLVMHHALYDQTSLTMLQRQIEASYAGRTIAPSAPFSRALQHLYSLDGEAGEKSWSDLLKECKGSQLGSFPQLQNGNRSQATSIYTRSASLSWSDLSEAAKKLDCSARPLLQVAWGTVVSAYSDCDAVLIGDSISTRGISSDLNDVFGPVLSTLPIPFRLSASGATRFRDVVAKIDEVHRRGLAMHDVSLKQIRRLLEVPHDQPLFSSVFVFEPVEAAKANGEEKGFELEHLGDFGVSVEHDVAIEVKVGSHGQVDLALTVRDAVVNEGFARLILAQFDSILRTAVANPDVDLSSPSSLVDEEQQLCAVSELVLPQSIVDAHRTPVTKALETWASKAPTARALHFYKDLDDLRTTSLTYEDLDRSSSALAHHLGTTLPSRCAVAVSLARSTHTYQVLLGILKAGLVYLPIDESLPKERKRELIIDSGAKGIICEDESYFDELDGVTLITSLDWIDGETRQAQQELPVIKADDRAYILYTSGSTGRPKGCVLTHANLSVAIESFRLMFDREAPGTLNERARFLARSVEAFDVALLEALLPLQVGATIVTAPRRVILEDLERAMAKMSVTHAAVVPSLFYSRSKGRRIEPRDLPDLKALIVGGERVSRDIVDAWAGAGVPLINAYGPTEACIGISTARLQRGDSTGRIGQAFPGSQYLVVRRDSSTGKLIPALRGQAGELCIAGLQVGSYLSGGDDAFTEYKGMRIYRTGDEARMGATGDDEVEYLGRIVKEGQVKVRGARVELSEVDSNLATPGIHVSTQLLDHVQLSGQPRLVSFIARQVSQDTGEVKLDLASTKSAQEALSRARKSLPTYMVPALIIPVEALPLASISGKVDLRKLAAWYRSEPLDAFSSLQEAGTERELTAKETMVAEEVKRLLPNVETQVNPSTDLFGLGLDSLSVISLAASVRRRTGFELDIGAIMAEPTVEAVARAMSSTKVNGLTKSSVWLDGDISSRRNALLKEARARLQGADVVDAYPCLPLQASMVAQTLSASVEEPMRYINKASFRIGSPSAFDLAKLRAAIDETLNAHDIFRTVFLLSDEDGEPLQAVLQAPVDYYCDSIERGLEEVRSEFLTRPPLRYSIRDGGTVLDIAIHHGLYDGASLALMLEEVEARYLNRPRLHQETPSFSSIVWQNTGEEAQEQKLSFWKGHLQGFSATPFPCLTGQRPPSEQEYNRRRGATRETSEITTGATLRQLTERARAGRVTLQVLCLSAFANVFARYVGAGQGDEAEDFTFGLVLSGRTSLVENVDKVQGPCVNTVPFCVRAGGESIQQTYAAVVGHQHVSLPSIMRELGHRQQLFNTLFSYNPPSPTLQLLHEVSSDLETEYPLAVEVQPDEKGDTIVLRAVYDPRFVPEAHAELLLRQINWVLCGSGESSQAAAEVFASGDTLWSVENANPYEPTAQDHFLARFRRNVDTRPEATAFVFADSLEQKPRAWSYAELDAMSDGMARALAAAVATGQRGEPVIGVHLPQCPDLYDLILAIWKSGMAYLPFDPALPEERFSFMAGLVRPRLIVTTEQGRILASKYGQAILVEELAHGTKVRENGSAPPTTLLESPAYIMFTSGSTGQPKGVKVSHRALAGAISSWERILPHTPGSSRLLQLASPAFDVFLIEVCMPLALGFSFGSAPKMVLLNDAEAAFRHLQLTMADLPAALATLVHPENVGADFEWLMSGGDQIDARVLDNWGPRGLVNAWGPTETTIGNTLGFVTARSSRANVGKAYAASTMLVVDSVQPSRVLLRGAVGELAVAGPQLAEGYVGRDDLTRERFLVVTKDGKRLYRTGDRGRILADGTVECLGRTESGQVKINSQRVELEEISTVLRGADSAIKDAATLYTRHATMHSKQLVAFVVLASDQDGGEVVRGDEEAQRAAEACQEAARKLLAHYMVPQHVFVLRGTSLPLTPNNKVDRKKLEQIYQALSIGKLVPNRPADNEADEEWTPLEKQLRELVARACKVSKDDVGRTTSLYRLGIDSISSLGLVQLMRKRGLRTVAVRDVLKAPSIASLASLVQQAPIDETADVEREAELIEEALRAQVDVELWKLGDADEIESVLPCTPLQQGMLLESLASEGGLYVHRHAFNVAAQHLEGVVEAFRQQAARCDVLRTTFHLTESSGFLQVVHSCPQVSIVQGEGRAAAFTTEEDLVRPPWQLAIVPMGDHAGLTLTIHHALYDGEGLDMLLSDIERRVAGLEVPSRRPFSSLVPLLLSKKDDVSFHIDRLRDFAPSVIGQRSERRPARFGGRAIKSGHKIKARAKQAGCTVQVCALAAFARLLSAKLESRKVVFGHLVGLRDAFSGGAAANVIGPALNTVLVPVDLDQAELLTRLQRELDDGRTHRAASLGDVLRETKMEFDTLVDFRKARSLAETTKIIIPTDSEEAGGLSTTQYAFNVEFIECNDGRLEIEATADRALFSEEELSRWLEELEGILVDEDERRLTPFQTASVRTNGQEAVSGTKTQSHEAPGQEGNVLRSIVASMAKVDDPDMIDAEATFASLGLDSIAAISLASKARRAGIRNLAVADILQGGTITAALARRDRRSTAPKHTAEKHTGKVARPSLSDVAHTSGIAQEYIDEVLPVLPGQVYHLAGYLRSRGRYGVFSFAYRVTKSLAIDEKQAREAWEALLKQHAILRTVFVQHGGHVCQVVLSQASGHTFLPFDEEGSDLEGALQRWAAASLNSIGEDPSLPPVRCAVGACGGDSYVLLTMHHALYDAWSLQMIADDCGTLLSSRPVRRASTSFPDVVEQISAQSREREEETRAYWIETLKEIKPTVFGNSSAPQGGETHVSGRLGGTR
ncbi:hypothetical protein FA10DRAFT_260230 [Acaromyces ingoldii]|uniref:Carrier domain-containing protein n=1 Tax=Acaromyces ingoldii TaxID=215250 RepID=A0A316YRH8_9BASI|nr:hypothetical protein FA10DRAFT_260230 [Acaromyces ingoldii]PWN90385.1 hypothetical protein FA10DRAFT_260230 [Acaromyces ingoldii]